MSRVMEGTGRDVLLETENTLTRLNLKYEQGENESWLLVSLD